MPFTLAQVAVPGLAPYSPVWVGAGQIAFYLMLVVVGSFYVRRRIGQRAWRTLHYVTFLAFVGSTLHGLIAGTDSRQAVGLVDLRRSRRRPSCSCSPTGSRCRPSAGGARARHEPAHRRGAAGSSVPKRARASLRPGEHTPVAERQLIARGRPRAGAAGDG